MIPTETPSERAQDSEPAVKPATHDIRRRPARYKPTDSRAEAVKFVIAATDHLATKGIDPSPTEMQLVMRELFRNFAANVGLRGKQKDSVWNHVQIMIREAKSATEA
jgi:hypothetical protein